MGKTRKPTIENTSIKKYIHIYRKQENLQNRKRKKKEDKKRTRWRGGGGGVRKSGGKYEGENLHQQTRFASYTFEHNSQATVERRPKWCGAGCSGIFGSRCTASLKTLRAPSVDIFCVFFVFCALICFVRSLRPF